MPKPRSPRVARRRTEREARIIAIAARRFATEGLEAVSLEEIADEADVARGTLYSHFASKEALAAAVVEPPIERAIAAMEGVSAEEPRAVVEHLIKSYVELWREHADALRLAHRLQGRPLGRLQKLHGALMSHVGAALARAAEHGLLRSDDPGFAGKALMRLAVPLLELSAEHPDGDRLFVESLSAVILRPVPAVAHRGRRGALRA